jgi:hypothetical protein
MILNQNEGRLSPQVRGLEKAAWQTSVDSVLKFCAVYNCIETPAKVHAGAIL